MKRGTPAANVVAVSEVMHPLVAKLPPVYLVRVSANEPWLLERPMANDDVPKDPPQRRLIPPGTYRVTHNIVIEGELTLEQLQALFVPANATVRVQPSAAVEVPEASPEELERRRVWAERARHLAEAYREKLGEGPKYISDTLEQWLKEGWAESELRNAFDATALARGFGMMATKERYEYLREVLRGWRREGKR